MPHRVMINIDNDWPLPGDLVVIGKGPMKPTDHSWFPGKKILIGHAAIPVRFDPRSGKIEEWMDSGKEIGLVLPDDSSQATRFVPVLVGTRKLWFHVNDLNTVEDDDDEDN